MLHYQLYVNNKMLQGLRPERGMLKKVLFAASKIYQENNQKTNVLIPILWEKIEVLLAAFLKMVL